MKKLLCLLFFCALAASVLTGVNVCAKESVSACVWEPTEILLTSVKTYKNPDVKIDAVFTHSDGTTITLPDYHMDDSTNGIMRCVSANADTFVTSIAELAVYTKGESSATTEPENVTPKEEQMDGKVINPLWMAIPVAVIVLMIAAPIIVIKMCKSKKY